MKAAFYTFHTFKYAELKVMEMKAFAVLEYFSIIYIHVSKHSAPLELCSRITIL